MRDGELSQEQILAGVPYSIEYLRSKHERMEWAVYCQLTRNARRVLSPDDFTRLGGAFASSTSFRVIMLIARLVYRPTRFLQWMQSMQREGHEMFSCVHSVSETPDLDHFTLTLTINEKYEDCPEFFYITKGTMGALPRLLGSEASTMECTVGPHQAIYEMYVPPREGLVSRARRILASPFRTAQAAGALQEAHQVLQLRYEQLDGARVTLDQQARQLRVAHVVNESLQHSANLANTLHAVVESLCAALDLGGAEVVVHQQLEEEVVCEGILFGHRLPDEPLKRSLVARHEEIGELRLWPRKGRATEEELVTTLDFVLPNIWIAIENALNHDALQRSRDELEARVEQRTAELQTTRDELTLSLAELELAQTARARIFQNINHEIRTPLSIMRLASEEAREANGNRQTELVGTRLSSIDTAVERLLRLVDGLLILAASDEKKLGLHLQQADVVALIETEVQLWQPLARKNGICLSFMTPHARPILSIDHAALAGALGNLLSNAIKFTPDGGTIEVTLQEREDYAIISVTDSGVGMSAEFAARAFDRFSQGPEPVRPIGRGSGIGLSIVSEVASAHGGEVEAGANPSGGSIFSITLPLAAARGLDANAESPSPVKLYASSPELFEEVVEADTDASTAFNHTILIAEDEPELRNVMIRCLSPHYRVLSAADGEAALALAEANLPDLLVADISMPKMDGLELTRRFVEISGNRAARALLVTAEGALATRLEAFDAGAVDYMTKPFSKQELLARVRAQLSIRDVVLQLHEVEKLSAMGILGAGLAHEIRNPMNAVVNALKPLRRSLPAEVQAEGTRTDILLTLIEQAAGSMQDISRSISQLENSSELYLEHLVARDLIDAAIHALPELPSARVVVECPPEMTITCAPILIRQVMSNILENALHSSGTEGRFEIRALEEAGVSIVRMSNDGPAIERSQRERIFQPFFTTKAAGKGTGLGLAISRQAVQRHGGTLCVMDTAQGCTFEMRIPAA